MLYSLKNALICLFNMTTELFISILLAVLGWCFALFQLFRSREWEKHDTLITRKYEAYSGYMRKLDELNLSMRNNPEIISGISEDFLSIALIATNDNDINKALLDFNKKLNTYLRKVIEPLMIINQELSSLILVASKDLLSKLQEQKCLIIDLNNEMQNCLNVISAQTSPDYKILETIGHDQRWKKFESLSNEIVSLMRKELEVI